MIKINWGTGIALFYTLFAGTMIFMVIKSTTYDNSLVKEDYYAADIAYQQHYDKVKNTNALAIPIVVKQLREEGQIALRFPAEFDGISGEVLFFRPSSSQQDFSLALDLDDSNEQKIPIKQLSKGRWKVQIDWSAAGKDYYKEVNIVL